MEIKPSFFSLSGFLAPGLVTSLAFVAVWGTNNPLRVAAALSYCEQHKLEGTAGVVAGVVAIALLLAATFVIGCVLSEAFIFAGRTLILRPLMRERRNKHFSSLLSKKTLDDLLDGDLNTREAYVYSQTCGLDLHWYAGRVRMVGGSGLGLFIISVYAFFRDACGSAFFLLAVSVPCLVVAIYRSHKFDEYVAATAAVLLLTPAKKKEET